MQKQDKSQSNKSFEKKPFSFLGEQNSWWQPALVMFARLSAWVAAPAIVAAFLGNWLDEKYDSAPWGLVGTVGIAFTVSMVGLVIEASKEFKRLDSFKSDENKKEKK